MSWWEYNSLLLCSFPYQRQVLKVQLRPVVPLLVEFYPKFRLSVRFKFLHIWDSFVVKYIYPLFIYPTDFIEMLKTSQIYRQSHLHFRVKLYEQQNYWTQLYTRHQSVCCITASQIHRGLLLNEAP